VGETNASLMGSLMITAIQLAAMSRADVQEDKRTDFYLYVDEFQNFATESFKNILSEARKYHLNLTIAHQYIAQMEDSGVREAIFGNVGTMVTFRVGAEDANVLAKEFNPPFEVEDLVNLERQNIYLKMTVDGKAESAFSARTLTVVNEETGFMNEIIERSREKYTRAKTIVEREVVDWTDADMRDDNAISEGKVIDKEKFEAPMVKTLEGRYDNKKKLDLSEVIRANTSHLDKPKVNIAETAKAKQKMDVEPEVRIKDKIDKEILSEILNNVVRPSEPTATADSIKPDINAVDGKNENQNGGVDHKMKGVDNKQITTAPEVRRDVAPTPTPKHEKIITPANFKKVKEIHPHEVVKVVADDKEHDLAEGQEIHF
jgi:hypothetical protein